MKKLAIISVNGTAKLGGVERVVADQCRSFGKIAKVRVVSLPFGGIIGALRRIQVFDLLLKAIFPAISSLIARIWAGRSGVVVTHGYSSNGYCCDVAFGHGCWASYLRTLKSTPGPFSRFVLLYEKSTARHARRVVLVSDRVKDQWVELYGLDQSRAEVLTNTVDTKVFHPFEGASDPCSTEVLKVLFVGSFVIGKGSAYLTHLYEEIFPENSNVVVTICSPRPVPEHVQRAMPGFRYISQLDSEALMKEYNGADLFILPSLYEAFEMSSLEALACGTPVLLNNTGARPTLEGLGCPGVFCLEDADSPGEAIESARKKFKGLQRHDLGEWTRQRFDVSVLEGRLLSICGFERVEERKGG